MVQSRIRSLMAVGGLVVAGAALAGCGGGSPAATVAPASTTSDVTATTAPVPATTVPVSATTVPAPATTAPAPATTVPATTVPAAPTPVGTGPSGGGPVLIVHAYGGSVGYNGREPSTIDFSGDSTNIVDHLTWSSWGPATAVGHGSLGLDNCEPNCAEGTVTQVPATIDLSKVADGHFTAMTEKAGTIFRSYSYPSNWATGAS